MPSICIEGTSFFKFFSSCWEVHVRDVKLVLLELRAYGLTAKHTKCEWGMIYVKYLGHIIGSGVEAVPPDACNCYG